MKRSIGFAALLTLAPLLAGAQVQTQDRTTAQNQAQIQDQARAQARVDAALKAALEAGIPVMLLERKVAEGKAKGVPMARIAAAVEARLEALTRAQQVMQRADLESTTQGELSLAADAVQAGVSETALLEISKRAPQERRAVAVAVLADLVALGHASENALARVTAALKKGNEALVNLQTKTSSELRARGAAGVGAGVTVGGSTGPRVDLPARGKKKGQQ